ncbi:hypothetical protein [Mucilaginibacter sp.]|uniref:hypothetical protein n=1 Tax=Mucilaginibacter sp. TaxID=1882438 RepID=UPI0025DFBAA6|nr:hypothetical protein [Mucilaginibacter sp.]
MEDFVTHLKKERDRLLNLLSSVNNLLAEYDKGEKSTVSKTEITATQNTQPGPRKPKKASSLKDSVKNVVLSLSEFTRSTEITAMLVDLYPDKANNDKFQVQVSGILSDLGKSNLIGKYQFSGSKKDTLWGKTEWLNSDGTAKDGFFNII